MLQTDFSPNIFETVSEGWVRINQGYILFIVFKENIPEDLYFQYKKKKFCLSVSFLTKLTQAGLPGSPALPVTYCFYWLQCVNRQDRMALKTFIISTSDKKCLQAAGWGWVQVKWVHLKSLIVWIWWCGKWTPRCTSSVLWNNIRVDNYNPPGFERHKCLFRFGIWQFVASVIRPSAAWT